MHFLLDSVVDQEKLQTAGTSPLWVPRNNGFSRPAKHDQRRLFPQLASQRSVGNAAQQPPRAHSATTELSLALLSKARLTDAPLSAPEQSVAPGGGYTKAPQGKRKTNPLPSGMQNAQPGIKTVLASLTPSSWRRWQRAHFISALTALAGSQLSCTVLGLRARCCPGLLGAPQVKGHFIWKACNHMVCLSRPIPCKTNFTNT